MRAVVTNEVGMKGTKWLEMVSQKKLGWAVDVRVDEIYFEMEEKGRIVEAGDWSPYKAVDTAFCCLPFWFACYLGNYTTFCHLGYFAM